jgi:acyl carrier protein
MTTVKHRLQEWVCEYLGKLLNIAPESIALDRKLSEYGLDSIDAVLMAGELEEAFGLEIDAASFLGYDTLAATIAGVAQTLDSVP